MNKELKQFLGELRKNKSYGFLFTKLYYSPKSVLGGSNEPSPEEYDKINNYFDLILNNDFTKFIDLCLRDETFVSKLDISLYRKLSFFLYDSINFKKNYSERTINAGKNGLISTKDMSNFEIFSLLLLYKIYKEYEKLFDHNYSQEQVDSYNHRYAETVRQDLIFRTSMYYQQPEDKKAGKDLMLAMIKDDDYNDEPFLTRPLVSMFGIDTIIFDSFVCENRFCDIIEQLLSQNKLEGFVLDNVVQIISIGISIKDLSLGDVEDYKKRLGKEIIRDFDIEKAKKLVSDLTRLKNKNKNKRLRLIKQ